MDITIKTVKFVKQEDSPVDIKLPDTDTFYFQTGARISIAVIPKWTSWKKNECQPEEIWEYDLIIVDISLGFATTEKLTMRVSDIQDIYNRKEDTQLKKILFFLMKASSYDLRTREQFMADYNAVVKIHMTVLESNLRNYEEETKL